jgi:hypothetical protein
VLCREHSDWLGIVFTLRALADLFVEQGEVHRARVLFGLRRHTAETGRSKSGADRKSAAKLRIAEYALSRPNCASNARRLATRCFAGLVGPPFTVSSG